MIIAIDVHYRTEEAKIVAVQFENWTDEAANQVFISMKTDIAEYEPALRHKHRRECGRSGKYDSVNGGRVSYANTFEIDGYFDQRIESSSVYAAMDFK